jgi:nucleotide-binding universal stress UspA family protein
MIVATGKIVLLPTDGSPTANSAARFAEDVALAEQDTVLVLGVAERATLGLLEDPAVTAALRDYMSELVAAEAARIRETGVSAEELVVDADSPYEAILSVADERGADLIVMGTHGRTGHARAIIGSVADRVVRHAKVPVVLVPMRAED